MPFHFSRSVNIINAGLSYSISSLTGRIPGRWMPVAAGIELTNYCNLRCPECLSGSGLMTRPAGFMRKQMFEKITDELKPYLIYLNLYFQGEPMKHPEFFDFIEKAGGIRTIVSTNGHFLSPDNAERVARSDLHRLVISLDGMSNDTYSRYRIKGDFEEVKKGIERVSGAIRESGSKIKLEIQFLVNRYNESQITEAREFASNVNAKLVLKSMQIINAGNIEGWQPQNKKFRRYESVNGLFRVKSSFPDRCFRMWVNPVITWDGKVVPCCFDKDAENVMGDLNENSFREIWFGQKYMEFRRSLMSDRGKIKICRNCTSGLRGVKY